MSETKVYSTDVKNMDLAKKYAHNLQTLESLSHTTGKSGSLKHVLWESKHLYITHSRCFIIYCYLQA